MESVETKRCPGCQSDVHVVVRFCPECGGDMGGALAHLRVLDLTGSGTQYCGRLMADLGADVIKVEPPGGEPTRLLQPFAGDIADPERGINFLTLNINKKSVVLNLNEMRDRERFLTLAASADIIVEDGSSGDLKALGVGYEEARRINPGLIYVSVTPFGLKGPYSDYLGGELIVQAVGGLMYGYGDPDARPAMAPFAPAHQLTAQHVAFAALAALRHRNISGQGQHVEVSIQEIMANILAYFGRYASDIQINRRPGANPTLAPTNTYPTKDGFIYMQPSFPRHVEALFKWINSPVFEDDVWKDQAFRRQNGDILNDIISEFTLGFTKLEFASEAQKRHIPVTPLMTIGDLVQDDHLKSRDFFVTVDHPVAGKYMTPGGPFRMSESPSQLYRPPPLLGEHTDDVMEKLRESPKAEYRTPTSSPEGNASDETPLPLRGLRVLDFSRVWAGPYLTRYLAELGAEVFKVESHVLPDRGQAAGPFASFNFAEINRGKKSITLNFREKKALHLVERLIGVCDVVVENFRPGVLEGWGLGYRRLQELNPEIIYLNMPGMGTFGPRSSELAFGQSLLAYTGVMGIWAHPESPGITRPKVPLPDFYGAATGAFAILSALEYRDRVGKGQMIELAQLEALVATMGVTFLDYSINGRIPEAAGNWNPDAAPHDVYRCLGDDTWCAIACYTDAQWQALGGAMDDPTWAHDPKFATLERRLENLEELNTHINVWTQGLTARQVMRSLQRAGVPAGIVANSEDLYYDINLRERDYVKTVDHRPVSGIFEHPGATVRLSETPSRIVGPCPQLGQHNEFVFGDLLGLSNEEIKQLTAEEVIY